MGKLCFKLRYLCDRKVATPDTRSRYSSWAGARDGDLEAVNLAAELQPAQGTILPRTASVPQLVLFLFAFLQSAKILFKA